MERQNNTVSEDEYQTILARMMALKLPGLKAVAKSLSIAQSGRKADVQDRIRRYLQVGKDAGDMVRLRAISQILEEAAFGQVVSSYDALYASIAHNNQSLSRHNSSLSSSEQQAKPHVVQTKKPWLFFHENPFFVLKKLVTANAGYCVRAPSGRGTCNLSFQLNETDSRLLRSEKNYKLYLLCGAYDKTKSINDAYIEFPQPLEIHLNGILIKDNVKGIKNKPGSAKPANLTPYIKPDMKLNDLKVVYAFTKTDYLLFCYLVEEIKAEKLLLKVLGNPRISKETTLNDFNKEEQDEDDLQEMSTILSLKCPLSFTRMKYPVKSIYCNHLGCFDALSYLYLQEQAATWQCPICSHPLKVKELCISEYVLEIINKTPLNVDSAEIGLDGSWKPIHEEEDNDDDSDDGDYGPQVRNSSSAAPHSKEKTPSSRTPNPPVVILLSSDEEEEELTQPTQPTRSNQPERTAEPSQQSVAQPSQQAVQLVNSSEAQNQPSPTQSFGPSQVQSQLHSFDNPQQLHNIHNQQHQQQQHQPITPYNQLHNAGQPQHQIQNPSPTIHSAAGQHPNQNLYSAPLQSASQSPASAASVPTSLSNASSPHNQQHVLAPGPNQYQHQTTAFALPPLTMSSGQQMGAVHQGGNNGVPVLRSDHNTNSNNLSGFPQTIRTSIVPNQQHPYDRQPLPLNSALPPLPPPHVVRHPPPSSLFDRNAGASPARHPEKTQSNGQEVNKPNVYRSVSNPAITNSQSDLRQRLQSLQRAHDLNRASSLGSNRGNQEAMNRIMELQKALNEKNNHSNSASPANSLAFGSVSEKTTAPTMTNDVMTSPQQTPISNHDQDKDQQQQQLEAHQPRQKDVPAVSNPPQPQQNFESVSPAVPTQVANPPLSNSSLDQPAQDPSGASDKNTADKPASPTSEASAPLAPRRPSNQTSAPLGVPNWFNNNLLRPHQQHEAGDQSSSAAQRSETDNPTALSPQEIKKSSPSMGLLGISTNVLNSITTHPMNEETRKRASATIPSPPVPRKKQTPLNEDDVIDLTDD